MEIAVAVSHDVAMLCAHLDATPVSKLVTACRPGAQIARLGSAALRFDRGTALLAIHQRIQGTAPKATRVAFGHIRDMVQQGINRHSVQCALALVAAGFDLESGRFTKAAGHLIRVASGRRSSGIGPARRWGVAVALAAMGEAPGASPRSSAQTTGSATRARRRRTSRASAPALEALMASANVLAPRTSNFHPIPSYFSVGAHRWPIAVGAHKRLRRPGGEERLLREAAQQPRCGPLYFLGKDILAERNGVDACLLEKVMPPVVLRAAEEAAVVWTKITGGTEDLLVHYVLPYLVDRRDAPELLAKEEYDLHHRGRRVMERTRTSWVTRRAKEIRAATDGCGTSVVVTTLIFRWLRACFWTHAAMFLAALAGAMSRRSMRGGAGEDDPRKTLTTSSSTKVYPIFSQMGSWKEFLKEMGDIDMTGDGDMEEIPEGDGDIDMTGDGDIDMTGDGDMAGDPVTKEEMDKAFADDEVKIEAKPSGLCGTPF